MNAVVWATPPCSLTLGWPCLSPSHHNLKMVPSTFTASLQRLTCPERRVWVWLVKRTPSPYFSPCLGRGFGVASGLTSACSSPYILVQGTKSRPPPPCLGLSCLGVVQVLQLPDHSLHPADRPKLWERGSSPRDWILLFCGGRTWEASCSKSSWAFLPSGEVSQTYTHFLLWSRYYLAWRGGE